MADAFRKLRELCFPRQSKRTGKPEQLRIQLAQAGDGPRFVTLCHFWQADSGEFFPPSKDAPRLTIRASEAAEVIALLRELVAGSSSTPPMGARAEAPSPRAETDARNGFDISRGFDMVAKRSGTCAVCGHPTEEGDPIVYDATAKRAAHAECCPERDRSPVAEAARKASAGLHSRRHVDPYGDDPSQGGLF